MRGGMAIVAIASMASIAAATALAACFAPSPPSGAPCARNDECPAPYACVADHCVATSITGPDGGTEPTGDVQIVPSNGVPASLVDGTSAITIAGDATFDTDTGAITGSISRSAAAGLASGIAFQTVDDPAGGLGVFAMSALTIAKTSHVRFTGRHAAVLVIATTATIAGTLDVSAGCDDASQHCGGPGGGDGSVFSATTLAHSPGGLAVASCVGASGLSDATSTTDTGGGGGGGGRAGAIGGAVQTFAGGAAGPVCIDDSIVPLVGGGGGGGGGPGLTGQPSRGGGGGGALQLDVLTGSLTLTGTIIASGGGGEGGVANSSGNAGAGAGGGAGGAILLEAVTVALDFACVIAANGGGGGGGANQTDSGKRGQAGRASIEAAAGGTSGAAPATDGGSGGALFGAMTPPDLTIQVGNAGGGGGAAGRVRVSAVLPVVVVGTISPIATLSIATTSP